jgi:hypothetical protein
VIWCGLFHVHRKDLRIEALSRTVILLGVLPLCVMPAEVGCRVGKGPPAWSLRGRTLSDAHRKGLGSSQKHAGMMSRGYGRFILGRCIKVSPAGE